MNIDTTSTNTSTHSALRGVSSQHTPELRFFGYSIAANEMTTSLKQYLLDFNCYSSILERYCVLLSYVRESQPDSEMIGKAFTSGNSSEAMAIIEVHGQEIAKHKVRFATKDMTYPSVTPFWLACRTGHLKVIKALYQDPTQLTERPECINGPNGRTPLMLAVMYGYVDIVKQLLEWGANPQEKDNDGLGVDYMNIYFNHNLNQKTIAELLTEYRGRNGMQQYDSSRDPLLQPLPIDELQHFQQRDIRYRVF